MSVLAELDQIIKILEADLPANLNSPQSQRLVSQLEKKLSKYFDHLADAFPYQKIDKIYTKHVKESAGSEAEDILEPILRTFSHELTIALSDSIAQAWLQGSVEMVTWGKTKAGIPIAYEGPPIDEAVQYAKTYMSKVKLVDGLNATSKKELAKVISDGIKNKRGIPGIKSDIRHKFDWMARGAKSEIPGRTLASRAEMIARTETNNALSQAQLQKMQDMDITGKEWITAGDDRVSEACLQNEADGAIPRDQSFSSGAMAPPEHPNCRCSLAPVMLKK